jgi:hypothetical protein
MPEPEAVRYTNEQFRAGIQKMPLGLREWPALLRKLDRMDPSFRD